MPGTSTQCNRIVLAVIVIIIIYLCMCKDSNFTGGRIARMVASNNDDNVKNLSTKELKQLTNGGNKITFVKYYMPNCGWCKKMSEEWKQLASYISKNPKKYGKVNIVEFDATASPEHSQLARQMGAVAYPTLVLYVNGKRVEYQGDRAVQEWRKFIDKYNF